MALVNLALLDRKLGKPGGGINPLRGQNNVQGAAAHGMEPGILPGYVRSAGKSGSKQAWHVTLPTNPGIEPARDDGLRRRRQTQGAVVDRLRHRDDKPQRSRNPPRDGKHRPRHRAGHFINETAKEFADVFLPGASSFEKDGTFMNGERRVQRIRKAVEPRGSSRIDQQIVCDLAAAMGFAKDFDFWSAEEVWNEVRAMWPPGYGITYDRIEEHGIQWPCPTWIIQVSGAARHELLARANRERSKG